MGTTLQATQTAHSRNIAHNKTTSAYENFIAGLRFSYFGLITMTILVGSMIGAISAMFILKNHAPIWELGLCMGLSMTNNVAGIGQVSTRWVVNIFLACVAANAFLILLNII
jgi:ABC-type transporter Mla maintaining outer membrane lipid asymmetry permease subunit MlaE